jgi:hypothetical protein
MKSGLFLAAGLICLIPFRFMAQDKPSGNLPVDGPKIISAGDAKEKTNNFYDNAETYALSGSEISIEGEVENPGKVDFRELQKHSVIAKEAILGPDGQNRFTGAYRYDGYSLFDILNNCILKKKNKDEFPPVIDLYILIENYNG